MANKKYIDFPGGTYTATDILLQADPVTGDLEKILLGDIINDSYIQPQIRAYKSMGSAAKAIPIDWTLCVATTSATMNDQSLILTGMWLNSPQTINGIKWYQSAAGIYTANNYNGVGLYSYAAGTITLRASSTNDGTIGLTFANQMGSKAFTTPYAASAGLYFTAFLYCRSAQTTAPILEIPCSHSRCRLCFTRLHKLSKNQNGSYNSNSLRQQLFYQRNSCTSIALVGYAILIHR